MTVRCERCDVERRDQYDVITGDLIKSGRKYAYPDGYLFSKDNDEVEPPRRIDFRRSWIEQEIIQQRINRQREARPGAPWIGNQ